MVDRLEEKLPQWKQDFGLHTLVINADNGPESKVSSDLQEIIRKRPQLFADLIRQLKSTPDHAILRIARDVRDGDW